MQLFPERVRRLWNGWEIRVLVLLSLCLQFILILLGSRRKHIARSWISIVVWSTYLMADWVATVALGNMAIRQEDYFGYNLPKSSQELQAFWAPFLLLHLGGPDTITAYSLEDNELWLRHFLGLLVQVGVAIYVFFQFWSNSALSYLAIPMFITGIIKYGERTFVLWSSSTERFKETWLSDHHPIPYFAQITRGTLDEHKKEQDNGKCQLLEVVFSFNIFARLFAGTIFDIKTVEDRILEGKSAENAFNMVAMELGLLYDLLYTKATIIYSQFGAVLRCISLFCSVSTLVFFSVLVNIHVYSPIEISITYLLLVGAVVLEVYAIILQFFSDWTKLICLIKSKNSRPNCFNAIISPHSLLHNQKRWSESMGQFNLISFCLKDMSAACIIVEKLSRISKFLEKYQYLRWAHVDLDMKEMILTYIQNRVHHFFESEDGNIYMREKFEKAHIPIHEILVAARGDDVLNRSERVKDFLWTIDKVEFDRSLIIWHIATDISYYADLGNSPLKCKLISKDLSDYMLYLLVLCPSMMPKGRGELRFRETSEKAKSIFKSKRIVICNDNRKIKACQFLLEEYVHHKDEVNADLSALLDGCKLGKALQELEYEEKWNVISQVWVEMLTYAAARCKWKEHGQTLKRGGELLTHVSLLLTHFGLGLQFRTYGKPHP